MGQSYIERRTLHTSSLSKDIAQHLYTRQIPGVTIILTDKPDIFLSSIRKQWFAVLRAVQKERASTLTSSRIQELNRQSMYMQRLRMVATAPDPEFPSGVFLVEPAELMVIPHSTHTIYLASKITDDERKELLTKLPPKTLVVLY